MNISDLYEDKIKALEAANTRLTEELATAQAQSRKLCEALKKIYLVISSLSDSGWDDDRQRIKEAIESFERGER